MSETLAEEILRIRTARAKEDAERVRIDMPTCMKCKAPRPGWPCTDDGGDWAYCKACFRANPRNVLCPWCGGPMAYDVEFLTCRDCKKWTPVGGIHDKPGMRHALDRIEPPDDDEIPEAPHPLPDGAKIGKRETYAR